MKYIVTAEHCCGASVSHPCSRGVFTDPTEDFEMEVEAKDEDEAVRHGHDSLWALAEGSAACDCRRRLRAGSNAWWNSVAIHATPKD